MFENIAGYIDRSVIKGQTYRYAATPKPVVFTGNIDEISDSDLLSKAMFVTRGQVDGTLPNNFGNTFLITTIKYGSNAYLQTAYLVQSGYECWEYRRIYSSGWTEWIGVDSAINLVNSKIEGADEKAESALAAINGTETSLGLDTRVRTVETSVKDINDNKLTKIAHDVEVIDGNVKAMNNSITTQSLSCSSLNGLSFTKMAIVTTTHSSIGVSKSGVWYASNTMNVNISSYGFNSVIAVFPGIVSPGDYGGTTYIVSASKTNISYKLYRQTDDTLKNRTDAFLIIGT